MKADLHMHTTESDGRLTREELFKHVKSRNIDMISITDHDTCKHVDDNIALAKEYGIQYIPGIELSTLYEGKNVHLLGYFRGEGYKAKKMLNYYVEIKKGREERAKKFVKNLKQFYNIEITYQDILDVSNGIIARPHIAKAIIQKYPQYTHNEIFDRFIGDHTEAFVPSTELHVSEGIKLLREHNCLIVLAHPKLLKHHIHDKVLAYDYDGIEAIYGMHDYENMQYYKKIAKNRNLIITAGSDYHGIPNDHKHKDVGDVYLEGEDLKRFLEALGKTK
ncbi:MAG: PHP domain-containing protein [Candidatus Izemoplasmataceae bacterium]|uniref:PHP domain-containing protein n=1 Tax=Liberiplasma polymorphum TaxID=3374570 RepID=UPI0037715F45